MDQIQHVMLQYRAAEAITFFLCLEPHMVGLGAKADVGGGVYTTLSTWPVAPEADADRTPEILAEMREMAEEIRTERHRCAPPEPEVQLG